MESLRSLQVRDEKDPGDGEEEECQRDADREHPIDHGAGLAEEGEDQFARLKTLRKIKEAYVYRRNKKRDYMSLFLFSVFLGLYLGILYEQTQAESAYGIVWTMQNSVVPQNENTDEDQLVYSSKDNIFSWMKETFGPIWADPKCGDGECSRQTEYPGFGKFGCTADCGPYPPEFLSTLHIDIQPSYKVDETDAVMSDLGDKFLPNVWKSAKQLEWTTSGAAVESCWSTWSKSSGPGLAGPNGPSSSGRARHGLVREAQDAVRRHPSTVYVVDTSTTPRKQTPVCAWDYCSHTWAPRAQNHRGGAGAPAGPVFNMYKHSTTPSSSRPPRAAVASSPPLPPMAAGLSFALAQGIHQSHVRARRAARLRGERRELARRRKYAETASSSPPPRTSRRPSAASAAPPAPDVLRGEDHVHRRAGRQRRRNGRRPTSPPRCSATPTRSSRR